jgi:hypothetical protein
MAPIAMRVSRWRFDYPTTGDRARHRATRAAAAFLREHSAVLSAGPAPISDTQIAVLAIRMYDLFLETDDGPSPAADALLAEIKRRLESP